MKENKRMKCMPDCEKLQYCGRIDFDNPRKPVFVFPGSYVKVKFFGKKVEALVKNKNYYWDNFLYKKTFTFVLFLHF